MLNCLLLTALCLTPIVNGPHDTQPIDTRPIELGAALESFELQDFRGRKWSTQDFQKPKLLAVVFFGTKCPLVKLFAKDLAELDSKYDRDELQLIGINSNRQDSLANIRHFAKEFGIKFPLLKDVGNRVADQIGAQRTPQVFLFDEQRKLRYHGRISDKHTYGLSRDEAQTEFLAEAIRQLLAGKNVNTPVTETEGCIIGRIKKVDPNSDVTFANQVSRILQDHCVSCHRPGEVAPFSLTDHEEVAGWADMIVEVVDDGRMPPWHAKPDGGILEFKNDARLSESEKNTLRKWARAGAPMGDSKDLPEPAEYSDGWRIGEPDLVIQMKEPFPVPATGVVDYHHVEGDKVIEQDTWIRAAECRPDKRGVVHHIIVGILDENEEGFHGGEGSEWIAATAPGAPPMILGDGQAKFIPAGSRLVFQMHYTPNGTATMDQSKVGFVTVKPEEVKHLVRTRGIYKRDELNIKPYLDDQRFEQEHVIEEDTWLLALFPHMHKRGKSFTYEVSFPGDARGDKPQVLLDIPNYDFNWQNAYELAEPMLLPAGTVIKCKAVFDNSSDNFANPDASQHVNWGDQTDDEMMIGYFDSYPAKPRRRSRR